MALPAISVRYMEPPARHRSSQSTAGDMHREVEVTQAEPSESFRRTFERLPRRPPKRDDGSKDGQALDIPEQTYTVVFVLPDGQKVATEVGDQLKIGELKDRLASSICRGTTAASCRIVLRGSILQDDRTLASYNIADGTELRLLTSRPRQQSGGAARNLLVNAPRGMLMVPPSR
mmetsp:Transcript_44448/g.81129  ORF Transcript_44448/g.81129 Transcript_44448/m.81129 type:complete len:175 (+) Transcript_44448:74-598(+)